MRENDYQTACNRQKEAVRPQDIEAVAATFDILGDYKDSSQRLAQCRQRLDEMKEERAARNLEYQRLSKRRSEISQKIGGWNVFTSSKHSKELEDIIKRMEDLMRQGL